VARERDHCGSKVRAGSEDVVEAQQVEAGWRDQHAEFLNELQGVQEEMGGAIPTRVGKLVEKLPVGALGQPVEGQRGPQEVAAEMFELLPGAGVEGHIGVQGSRRAVDVRPALDA
jgi:hypothetical protein